MIALAHFPSAKNHNISRQEQISWEDFVAFFRAPLSHATPKDALPLWSAATYDPPYIADANVQQVFSLAFDVDEDPIPTADTLRELPWCAVVSTSPSATAQAPRWRLVIALARPVTGAEYRRVWDSVSRALAALGVPVGKASRNPSRGWFAPRIGIDGYYETFEVPGDPLDVDAVLAAPEAPETSQGAPAGLPAPRTSEAAAAALAAAWPARGKRCGARLALMGACRRDGMAQADAAAFVKAVHEHLADRGDVDDAAIDALAASTYRRGDLPTMGWNSLQAHVSPSIVRATKDLLNPAADWLAVRAARAEATVSPPSDAEASRRRFTLVSADALSKPVPKVSYVLRHFGIAPGRPSLLAGYGGSGKTFVVGWLALHVAAGKTHCWGLPIASGNVLHLDYEMTLSPTQRRYQRMAFAMGVSLSDCSLTVASMPSIYLSDSDAEAALVSACVGQRLCVIDNLAAAIATSKESRNDESIRAYLDLLTRVSSTTDCTFIVLVHERKAAKDDPGGLQRVRGSSAITDAAGSVLSLSPAEGDAIVTLSHTKTSHRRQGDELSLIIEDQCGSFGDLQGIPDEDTDPPGLIVRRIERISKEQRERQKEREQIDRAKIAMIRAIRDNPEGLIRRDLLTLTRPADNNAKASALIELLRSGEVQQTGTRFFLKTQ